MPADTPTLRRASNSFKHGLYATKLAYSTPEDHALYSTILHDYSQHYRPITPDEETLVQQLAALQFRHLKVQTFQADSMRAEVLRQCQSAAPEADGSTPSETAIETRAFEALCEKPAFRLYLQELNRLPNKIQRTIDRIYILLRLRSESATWSAAQPETEQIPTPQPKSTPEPLEITPATPTKSEQKPQTQGTKPEFDPITSKELLVFVWNRILDPQSRAILLYGPANWEPRREFFTRHQLPEAQFHVWIEEALLEGTATPPPDTDGLPQAA